MRTATLLALLLAAGCVAAQPRPPPPPPPAPPSATPAPPPAPARPAFISEAEAVRIAANYARSRGYDVQRYKAKLDGDGRWQVLLRAQRGEDRAQVLIDARSGRVLELRGRDVVDRNG